MKLVITLCVILLYAGLFGQQVDFAGRNISGDTRLETDGLPPGPTLPENTGNIQFGWYQQYETGSWPEVVATVTVGGQDAIVLGTSFYFDEENDYTLRLFERDGDSLTVTNKVFYPGSSTERIESMAAADLIGGQSYVIIGFSDTVAIYDTGLNLDTSYYSGDWVYSVTTGDFNNDGLLDIGSCHSYDDLLRVQYQSAPGVFDSYQTIPIESEYWTILRSANVDNLYGDDLLYVREIGLDSNLVLFHQNESGFNDGIEFDTPYGVEDAMFGDIDNDGDQDLVVVFGGNSPLGTVRIYYNENGLFPTWTDIQSYDVPQVVRLIDLNLDGNLEIVVLHGGWLAMSVFEQDSFGNYGSYDLFPIPYASHYPSDGMCVGDFNSDGRPDIGIADYNDGLIVLYNQSVVPEPSLTVGLEIDSAYVNIPADGAKFTARMAVTNSSDSLQSGEVSVVMVDPVGQTIDLFAPNEIQADGGDSRVKMVRVKVFPTDPAGLYQIIGMLVSSAGVSTDTVFFTKDSSAAKRLGAHGQSTIIPASTELFQNYPNPFNPTTQIRYHLAAEDEVSLTIHNILGQEVATLVDTHQLAGMHEVEWNGRSNRGHNAAAGLYFIRIKTGEGYTQTRRMILMK